MYGNSWFILGWIRSHELANQSVPAFLLAPKWALSHLPGHDSISLLLIPGSDWPIPLTYQSPILI